MINNDFEHYLKAGHGRAYLMVKEDPEKYRDIVMAACRKDYTFNMWVEGSRAFLTADLIRLFEDEPPFLDAAIERFFATEIDDKPNEVQYLSDLLAEFGMKRDIYQKYLDLWDRVESMSISINLERPRWLLDNLEYIAIIILQHTTWKTAKELVTDIGQWYLTLDEPVYGSFHWFYGELKDRYGDENVRDKLSELSKESAEVREFCRVINEKDPKNADKPSLEEVISFLESQDELTSRDIRDYGIRRIGDEDIGRLAQVAVDTSSLELRAKIVSLYQMDKYRWKWPFDPSCLIEWCHLDNAELQEACHHVMTFIVSDDIREYARTYLQRGFDGDCVCMLVRNYREEDKELLLSLLAKIPISEDTHEIWHHIDYTIIVCDLPDEFMIWIYETTLCSFCREDAVRKLLERGTLPNNYIEECRWDARLDIRRLIEERVDL